MSATTELFANLRPHFKGELIRPDDLDYLIARRVWNSAAQRSPGLIARCADIADVQTVVAPPPIPEYSQRCVAEATVSPASVPATAAW